MKACRIHSIGTLKLHDEPEPVAGPEDALFRVTAVGICGSDLHWFEDGQIGDARLTRPLVLGHEFAGVAESGPHKGRRVAVDPAVPCNACAYCHAGHPNLCENVRFAGHDVDDGALREQMAWPARCLFPVPDSFSDADAAMLEPLGVAIHTVDLAKIQTGMTVGVFGSGPIGLLVMQVARAAGATRIIATDRLPHRLDAARAYADEVLEAADDSREGGAIWDLTGGGVDVAFEAAGANAAVEAAIDAVRPGGQVVIAGIPSDDRVAFQASTARRKGVTIKLVRRMKHVYPRAIALVERGLVDVRSLVTHRFALADAAEAFEVAQRREGLKVVIEPSAA